MRPLREPSTSAQLVGSLVDRLEMALVFELLARRRDVRMPDLGLPAPRSWTLLEWGLEPGAK
jgi:hypothetical protein